MSKSISIDEALAYAVKDTRKPLVSDYDLGVIIFNCYLSKKYKNFKLLIRKNNPSSKDYRRAKDKILEDNIIKPITKSLSYPYYKVVGSPNLSEQEIICFIDPFSYISHFSAIQFHDLIDKKDNIIFFTSPSQSRWKELALKKMKNELGENYQQHLENRLPRLKRSTLPKFKKKTVIKYSTNKMGSFISTNYDRLRVSTIGRTFLDMIRKAEYCGGMKLVVDIFQKEAKKHIDDIIDEIEKHGQKIDKVRAGYILDEVCKIKNDTVESWIQNAQRGGSQKLDSSAPYEPTYSEKWCLSINI